jgi:hypothetical protein
MSWWDLGEWSGYPGSDLALGHIVCGFCNEAGKFSTIHHEAKRNQAGKVLNYDTLQCDNCGNLTMVFWSASTQPSARRQHGNHDFRTIPWPRKTTKFPRNWPEDVGRYWLQARRSLEGKNWDAAALMARSAVQLLVRHQGAKKGKLNHEIDDLADKGLLPPIMKDWSHEVRVLGQRKRASATRKRGRHRTGRQGRGRISDGTAGVHVRSA